MLNQLASAVKMPGDCCFYVYCVNADVYTKNKFLSYINILPHSNKLFLTLKLKKSVTIFYQN